MIQPRARALLASAALVLAAPSTTPAMATPSGKEFTLEDITIEGNVVVPQVLFITARDQKRFLDDLHRRYLPSAATLGRSVELPVVVCVDMTPHESQGAEPAAAEAINRGAVTE
jgi:hypothetical protein